MVRAIWVTACTVATFYAASVAALAWAFTILAIINNGAS